MMSRQGFVTELLWPQAALSFLWILCSRESRCYLCFVRGRRKPEEVKGRFDVPV